MAVDTHHPLEPQLSDPAVFYTDALGDATFVRVASIDEDWSDADDRSWPDGEVILTDAFDDGEWTLSLAEFLAMVDDARMVLVDAQAQDNGAALVQSFSRHAFSDLRQATGMAETYNRLGVRLCDIEYALQTMKLEG